MTNHKNHDNSRKTVPREGSWGGTGGCHVPSNSSRRTPIQVVNDRSTFDTFLCRGPNIHGNHEQRAVRMQDYAAHNPFAQTIVYKTAISAAWRGGGVYTSTSLSVEVWRLWSALPALWSLPVIRRAVSDHSTNGEEYFPSTVAAVPLGGTKGIFIWT